MVVIVLENVPKRLRGELSRWMLEVSTGVFVGSMTALVRDLLWEKCVEKKTAGRVCMMYRTNNEQGFEVRTHGDTTRILVDFDGLTLVAVKNAEWQRIHAKRKKPKATENLEKENPDSLTQDSDTSEGSNG
ncbi:MAG: type I-E CRISPR-associated endoribonuclease Cas2e [Meiothermus sp.]|uniref:type I-E CRISPR-associated endoribonuclease Cas2e n=1 Tax=Meiothermus sp. TaxID=1955249 RepID=UPI00298F0905|nr:type I-E CRISPR-associated endoribonuclease Cas2e [Meiothermus sp.]MDW8091981.1 type I-E CRISPR-associated endoribonuclease Cas2e [Meiothermus sp.]MDW8481401.1 type I-E CRISPR-associated endoribonuclease Cas2e [Meiothermus sp.]